MTEEVNFVYCINCFEREDRYNASLKTLNDAGFTNIKWIRNHLHKVGRIGCAKAHMQVYKDIVESNLPYGIIFEDDIKFADNYDKGIEGLKEYLNQVKGWDMFFFGCININFTVQSEDILKGTFVQYHAYAITKNMAKKILKNHTPIDYFFHIDFLVPSKFKVRQYALRSHLATQRVSPSNNIWLGHKIAGTKMYEKMQNNLKGKTSFFISSFFKLYSTTNKILLRMTKRHKLANRT